MRVNRKVPRLQACSTPRPVIWCHKQPAAVALRIRNTPCRLGRNEKNTYRTHLAKITRTRVFTLLTQRNSLSFFNARDEAGPPSLSRTLCQSMIVEAQRNHRTEHRKEDVIQK